MPTKSPTISAAEIIYQVQANQARIHGCKRHRFPTIGANYRLGQKLTCENCGGIMDLREIGNYLRGFKAAGGDPRLVMEDWDED